MAHRGNTDSKDAPEGYLGMPVLANLVIGGVFFVVIAFAFYLLWQTSLWWD